MSMTSAGSKTATIEHENQRSRSMKQTNKLKFGMGKMRSTPSRSVEKRQKKAINGYSQQKMKEFQQPVP